MATVQSKVPKKYHSILDVYSRTANINRNTVYSNFAELETPAEREREIKKLKKELLSVSKKKSPVQQKKDAEVWYRKLLKSAKKRSSSRPITGRFYLFRYKAKWYPTPLEYYDRQPLIYLFDQFTDKGTKYLLGINFHWLSRSGRITLLKAMIGREGNNFDNNKRLKLRYNNIKNMPLFKKYGYVVIRKYIAKNIKKSMVEISTWEIPKVINLQTEKFLGISPEGAWKLTSKKMRKK